MDRLLNKATIPTLFIILLSGITPLKAQNLSEIYELAVQNDPTLKKALAERLATGESKDQSIALLLPVISATGASSRDFLHNKRAGGGDFRGTQVNQNFWSHTFNLNITQPLFHWDYWIQLSQSDNRIAQAEAAYQSEQQNLMMRTAEAYFNVLAAEDNLTFVESEKQAIGRQLERARGRFEVGIIAITDVNEAQAAFDQAESAEIEAANLVNDRKEALREIVGERDLLLDVLGEQLPLLKPDPPDINIWSNAAEANNFTIISALNQAEAARKSIEIQRSGHLPQLDLVASYGASDVNSSFGFRGDTRSVGMQLNVPLFEGGAVSSRTRQAQYEFEAAKENLTAVKRSIKRQIKDAYRAVMTNISRVGALKTTVASLETALEASEAGFEVGTRTMVDVLVVQRDLYRVKSQFARARYDYLINSIRLKQLSSNLTPNDLDQINGLLLADHTGSENSPEPVP
ncbi:MAG: TolC family outer membrane protein [Gammaproteobacteria bacterium]